MNREELEVRLLNAVTPPPEGHESPQDAVIWWWSWRQAEQLMDCGTVKDLAHMLVSGVEKTTVDVVLDDVLGGYGIVEDLEGFYGRR